MSQTEPRQTQLVASVTHTLITCAILLGIAALGFANARIVSSGGVPAHGLALYVPLLVSEWLLFLYVAGGLRRRGAKLDEVVADRWSPGAILGDIVVGVALLALWLGIERAWAVLAPVAQGQTAAQVLRPQTEIEIGVWLALSLSAGFVEELTFRGYLLRQLGALLKSPMLGLVAQAILFGVSHGYQGVQPALRITLFGLLFGAVAAGRGSVRAGVIAHTGVDIVGGLLS